MKRIFPSTEKASNEMLDKIVNVASKEAADQFEIWRLNIKDPNLCMKALGILKKNGIKFETVEGAIDNLIIDPKESLLNKNEFKEILAQELDSKNWELIEDNILQYFGSVASKEKEAQEKKEEES